MSEHEAKSKPPSRVLRICRFSYRSGFAFCALTLLTWITSEFGSFACTHMFDGQATETVPMTSQSLTAGYGKITVIFGSFTLGPGAGIRMLSPAWNFSAQRDYIPFWTLPLRNALELSGLVRPQMSFDRQTLAIDGETGWRFKAEIPFWLPLLLSGIPTLLLRRFLRRPAPGHCQTCRYNLTGNTSGRCPECGTELLLHSR